MEEVGFEPTYLKEADFTNQGSTTLRLFHTKPACLIAQGHTGISRAESRIRTDVS